MCKAGHQLYQGGGNTRFEFPAQLLYVSGGQDGTIEKPPGIVKLVQTSAMDADIEYLALSHCWVLKDAIVATISPGFPYIWIDTRCILQRDFNDEEDNKPDAIWRKDWESKAKEMGSVYSGAVCTIASTGSSSSASGCFHGTPCKIGVSSPGALLPLWIYARKDNVMQFKRGVDMEPLNTRGWALQERLKH
ncbi:hypothetical protein GGS24DRAFT_507924 [Hypoxylon argillaceum]|nr:hypothetical protein GGS24DRAFT_507924 [Hypoxylon argillaceum]